MALVFNYFEYPSQSTHQTGWKFLLLLKTAADAAGYTVACCVAAGILPAGCCDAAGSGRLHNLVKRLG